MASLIHFAPFRTRRILASMEEISMRNGLRVAGYPEDEIEQADTAFLEAVCSVSRGPSSPLDWTFQERALAVAHYLMVVSESGADFELGDAGHLSDYLDADHDYPVDSDRVAIGNIGGDDWYVQHLTGAMVEAIERTAGMIPDLEGREHWMFSAMAAQLVRDEDKPVDTLSAGAYDDYLIARTRAVTDMPESAFTALLAGWLGAREKQYHLFRYDFANDGGIVILPRGKEGAADLPPARFPASSCLSAATLDLGGKPKKPRA